MVIFLIRLNMVYFLFICHNTIMNEMHSEDGMQTNHPSIPESMDQKIQELLADPNCTFEGLFTALNEHYSSLGESAENTVASTDPNNVYLNVFSMSASMAALRTTVATAISRATNKGELLKDPATLGVEVHERITEVLDSRFTEDIMSEIGFEIYDVLGHDKPEGELQNLLLLMAELENLESQEHLPEEILVEMETAITRAEQCTINPSLVALVKSKWLFLTLYNNAFADYVQTNKIQAMREYNAGYYDIGHTDTYEALRNNLTVNPVFVQELQTILLAAIKDFAATGNSVYNTMYV